MVGDQKQSEREVGSLVDSQETRVCFVFLVHSKETTIVTLYARGCFFFYDSVCRLEASSATTDKEITSI